jgi:hypothetical protein
MKGEGRVTRMGDMRNLYWILGGMPEGKNHLVDLCVDGMILKYNYLQYIGCEGVDWIHQSRGRV